MSLLSIIGNISQALGNAQQEIGVVSNNIGNAQNTSYVSESATVVDTAAGAVIDVSPNIDQTLEQEMFAQSAVANGQGYLSQVYQQLEQLDGSSSGTPSLSSAAGGLVSAFQAYDASPDSTSAQQGVLQAAEQLVSTVHSLSDGIEQIATQTQTQTESDVSSLNSDLSNIASLNQKIVAAKSAGQSTANLITQRAAALSDASIYLPIKSTPNADGSINLSTPGGVSLVDGTTASAFTYKPYTLGTDGKQGTDASISLVGSSGTSLNGAFSGGKIGSELNIMRVDDAGANSTDPSVAPLEKMRRQLDAFVDQFYSSDASTPTAFQKAYNSGTAASGELASNFFVIGNQSPGGSPQGAGDDRMNFEINPALLNGKSTIKASSAAAVVAALTANSASNVSAGDIQGFTGTISGLADAIATNQTENASQVGTNATQSAANYSAVQTAYSNETGVNMDAQLSQLIVLQNSYSASARVITTANTMLGTLMSDYGGITG